MTEIIAEIIEDNVIPIHTPFNPKFRTKNETEGYYVLFKSTRERNSRYTKR